MRNHAGTNACIANLCRLWDDPCPMPLVCRPFNVAKVDFPHSRTGVRHAATAHVDDGDAGGWTVLHCVEGPLTMVFPADRLCVELHTGDSLLFDSTRPHCAMQLKGKGGWALGMYVSAKCVEMQQQWSQGLGAEPWCVAGPSCERPPPLPACVVPSPEAQAAPSSPHQGAVPAAPMQPRCTHEGCSAALVPADTDLALNSLVEMGFERSVAEVALHQAAGDIAQAATLLLPDDRRKRPRRM